MISTHGVKAIMSIVYTNDAPMVVYHPVVKSVNCPLKGRNERKVKLRFALVRLRRMPVLMKAVMKIEVMIALVLSE